MEQLPQLDGFVIDTSGEKVLLRAEQKAELHLALALKTYSNIFTDKQLWQAIVGSLKSLEAMRKSGRMDERAQRAWSLYCLLLDSVNVNKALFDYLRAYWSYLRFVVDGKLTNNQVIALCALVGLEDDTRGQPLHGGSFTWEALEGKKTKHELIRLLQKRGLFRKRHVATYYAQIKELQKKGLVRVGKVPHKTKHMQVLYVNFERLEAVFGVNKRLLQITGRLLIEGGLEESTKGLAALASCCHIAYGKGHVSDPQMEAADFVKLLNEVHTHQ